MVTELNAKAIATVAQSDATVGFVLLKKADLVLEIASPALQILIACQVNAALVYVKV